MLQTKNGYVTGAVIKPVGIKVTLDKKDLKPLSREFFIRLERISAMLRWIKLQ